MGEAEDPCNLWRFDHHPQQPWQLHSPPDATGAASAFLGTSWTSSTTMSGGEQAMPLLTFRPWSWCKGGVDSPASGLCTLQVYEGLSLGSHQFHRMQVGSQWERAVASRWTTPTLALETTVFAQISTAWCLRRMCSPYSSLGARSRQVPAMQYD